MNKEQKYTVALCTLGCKVNQYETQAMQEEFERLGFEIKSFDEKCDAYVINTCTVTAESDRKSRQMIRKAVKNGNGSAVVAVCGCYSQLQKEKLFEIDGVTTVFGTSEKHKLPSHVKQRLWGSDALRCIARPIERIRGYDKMTISRSERTRAVIKIVDGCENKCSYCIIPKARGILRSRRPEDVIDEVKRLAAVGYKEVVLTGIETASYGKDLEDCTLCDLLKMVDGVEGIERIRLGSLEPTVITEQFVKLVRESKHIVHHFHLSLQSGSSRILALMKRKYNADMFREKVKLLRDNLEGLTITTDIIVGFPDETNEDFDDTVKMVRDCGFLFVHIFPYSAREGTEAATYSNQLPEFLKKARASTLKRVMLDVREDVLETFNGCKTSVLFEEKVSENKYVGHTPNFIPCIIKSDADLCGKVVDVTLSYDKSNPEYMKCK